MTFGSLFLLPLGASGPQKIGWSAIEITKTKYIIYCDTDASIPAWLHDLEVQTILTTEILEPLVGPVFGNVWVAW